MSNTITILIITTCGYYRSYCLVKTFTRLVIREDKETSLKKKKKMLQRLHTLYVWQKTFKNNPSTRPTAANFADYIISIRTIFIISNEYRANTGRKTISQHVFLNEMLFIRTRVLFICICRGFFFFFFSYFNTSITSIIAATYFGHLGKYGYC